MRYTKNGSWAPAPRLLRRLSGPGVAVALGVAILALGGCTGGADRAGDGTAAELYWPPPPEQPRIKYVRSIRHRGDIGATDERSLADSLLGEPDQNPIRGLKKPYGVHADTDGRIFVTDTGWGKLLVFDPANKKLDVWGLKGQGTLSQPIGVTSDSTGRVYVTDIAQQRIMVFDREGEFVTAMGNDGNLQTPAGIALDEARRRIYVV